jgi:hypothetical protein
VQGQWIPKHSKVALLVCLTDVCNDYQVWLSPPWAARDADAVILGRPEQSFSPVVLDAHAATC